MADTVLNKPFKASIQRAFSHHVADNCERTLREGVADLWVQTGHGEESDAGAHHNVDVSCMGECKALGPGILMGYEDARTAKAFDRDFQGESVK